MKATDGSLDLMKWEIGIPGKANVCRAVEVSLKAGRCWLTETDISPLSFALAHPPSRPSSCAAFAYPARNLFGLHGGRTVDLMGERSLQAPDALPGRFVPESRDIALSRSPTRDLTQLARPASPLAPKITLQSLPSVRLLVSHRRTSDPSS